MDLSNLRGSQRQVLREAIIAAFTPQTLDMLLQLPPLEKDPLHVLVPPGPFRYQVFELVNLSQMEGWTDRLVKAVQQAKPDSPRIKTLMSDLSFIEVKSSDRSLLVGESLERTVRERGGVEDFVLWADKLAELRGKVCRIEDPRDPRNALGTGFLVGPDLLLTNYHVVEMYIDVIDPTIARIRDTAELRCRFDYAVDATGERAGTLKQFAPGSGWLIDYSKYSGVDPGDRGGAPQPTELDYALLRLAEPAGEAPAPAGAGKRGWIPMSTVPPSLQAKDILFIVQHPKGDPLKLAVGAVLERNPNGTRVRYDANTDGGSSGSPCFDVKLNLVAIHHAGDPDWKRAAEYNQGIPIERVIGHLASRGTPQFWT
jgi:hypothetical protein